MGGTELDFVHEAFDTNWIAPLGANVNGFEKDLAEYTGRKHAAAVTTGTSAIHLGLILCGVKPGDEVICQSFTFAASAGPIRYQGAIPIFIDSEPETWNMDPDLLEKALEERANAPKPVMPGAIIVVHLYGMPAKMDRIMEIANKYGIPVIEDSAESLGSSINGRRCGTFGRCSVLSFNGNKIITTSGGGALLSDDESLVKKARFLATQARDDAPHYQHSELGYNYRMSNIVAGIGRGQMKVLDERVAARRANHDFYFENLGQTWWQKGNPPLPPLEKGESPLSSQKSDMESKFPPFQGGSPTGIYFLPEPKGYLSNRWLTTILVNPEETGGVTREDIRLALEEKNIETRPLWKPMHLQPLYKEFESHTNGVSEFLFEYGLCLPSGSNLSMQEKKYVADAFKQVLNYH
jgi:dTDP-4-amino-4,6-dideoxygalactose transaminase